MAEAKYLPSHIANYLLWKANEEGIKDITPMKLLKLVYFCYAWYLAIYNKKLFSEQIEAWKYGPVVPSIYHEFKRFGDKPISNYSIEFNPKTGEISYPVVFIDDDETFKVLDAVWDNYKNKNGIELSKITHEPDSPWTHAYAPDGHKSINDEKIKVRAIQAIERFMNEQKACAEK